MMQTFFDLVNYKNEIKKIIYEISIDGSLQSKSSLITLLEENYILPEYSKQLTQIKSIYSEMIEKNNDIISILNNIIDIVDHGIMKTEFKEEKIRSLLPTNENIKNIFQAELAKYSQVKYPGLQINSRIFIKDLTNIKSTTDLDDTNFWISLMVSSDPFYMIGPNLEALQTSFSSYPETYQRRVRLYQWNDKRDLSILPQDQFNIIFCWDFFNYLTIETIDQFLSQMIRLLRPGGTLLFTYNNCDLADSARLVDLKLAGWTTPKLLEAIYLKLGFELDSLNDIISDETNISHVSWMKLKRPGELTTVKMSQAQGLIGRK